MKLTSRQRQLLTLISRGWTNKAIAVELGLTEDTVKVYLSALYLKLPAAGNEVSPRGAAMLWALGNPEALAA